MIALISLAYLEEDGILLSIALLAAGGSAPSVGEEDADDAVFGVATTPPGLRSRPSRRQAPSPSAATTSTATPRWTQPGARSAPSSWQSRRRQSGRWSAAQNGSSVSGNELCPEVSFWPGVCLPAQTILALLLSEDRLKPQP